MIKKSSLESIECTTSNSSSNKQEISNIAIEKVLKNNEKNIIINDILPGNTKIINLNELKSKTVDVNGSKYRPEIQNNENNPNINNVRYDSEKGKTIARSTSPIPLTADMSSLSTSVTSRRKARSSILLPFTFQDDTDTPPISPQSENEHENEHENDKSINSRSHPRSQSRRMTLSPATARFLMLEVIAEEAAAAVAAPSSSSISPKKQFFSLLDTSPSSQSPNLKISIGTDVLPSSLNYHDINDKTNSKFSPLSLLPSETMQNEKNVPKSLSNQSTPSLHSTNISPYKSPSTKSNSMPYIPYSISSAALNFNNETEYEKEILDQRNSMEITRENLNNSYFHGADLFSDSITGLPDLLLERDRVVTVLTSGEMGVSTDNSTVGTDVSLDLCPTIFNENVDISTESVAQLNNKLKNEKIDCIESPLIQKKIDEEVKNIPESVVEKLSNIENVRNIGIIIETSLPSSNSSSIVKNFKSETAVDNHQIFKELIEKNDDVKQIILLENKGMTITGDLNLLESSINTVTENQENINLNLKSNDMVDNVNNLKLTKIELFTTVETYDTSSTYIDELNALLNTTSDSDVSCSTTSSVPISTFSPQFRSPFTMESGSSSSLSLCTDIPSTLHSSSFDFADATILKNEVNIFTSEVDADDDHRNFDFLFSDTNINENYVGNSSGKKVRMLCDIRMDESEDGRCLLLNSFSNSMNNENKSKRSDENEMLKEELLNIPNENDQDNNLKMKKQILSTNLISDDLIIEEKRIEILLQNPQESLNFMDMDIVEVENEVERGSEKALVRRRDVLSPERHIFGKKSKVAKQGSEGENGDLLIPESNFDEAYSSDVTEMEASEVKNLFSEDLGSDSEDDKKVLKNEKIIDWEKNMKIDVSVDQDSGNVDEIPQIVCTDHLNSDFRTNSELTENSTIALLSTLGDEELEKRAFARLTVRNEIAKWKYLWELASYAAAKVSRERNLKKI